jgi:hypothetical protein
VNLRTRLLAGLGQRLEKVLAIHVIAEDVVLIGPAHHACPAKAEGDAGW